LAPAQITSPSTLDQWERFHASIEALPGQVREVFSMKWYLGASEATIADACGCSRSTVQRAWLQAKEMLSQAMGEAPPT
jgi:DNA-directed RNA polymerase specialized sigma24 family protein